jgi:membrane-bound metal-dependent hydrolase YbcI (DUF457 family)
MTKVIFTLAIFMTGEMLSVPFAALIVLPLIPLMKPLTASPAAERILAVVFIPAAAVTAVNVSYRLAGFVKHTSLPKTPLWLTAVITALIALYVAFGGAYGLKKWASFALPLIAGFIAITAILLAGRMSLQGSVTLQPFKDALDGRWKLIILLCEGITLLGLMPALGYTEKPFRAYLIAALTAVGIGAAVWSLSTFTLGEELYEKFQYPFYHALRIAKGGELIGRVESFLIPVLLCAAVLKIAAGMRVVAHGVGVWRRRDHHKTVTQGRS